VIGRLAVPVPLQGVVALLGGVRAALFALVAAALLVALGVQTWRVRGAQRDVAVLKAAAADWRAAQSTNLGTIAALRDHIDKLVEARRLEREAGDKAVAAAQRQAVSIQRTLEARDNELRRLYARDPAAARWADSGIPADVLRSLPPGQD
jgi:hypothetical protein